MANVVPFFPTGKFNIDFGVNNEINFAVLENIFGDGYIQRTADGLNSNRDTWNATWTNLTDAESALIFAFLRARGGYQPFYLQAPGDSDFKQWTARDVKRKPTGYGYWQISATLKQEFGSTIEVKFIQMLRGAGAIGIAGTMAGRSPAIRLIGVSATGRIGLITPSRLRIVGASATGSAGIILSGKVLTGVRVFGMAGEISISHGLGITPAVPGVSATGGVGALSPQIYNLLGVEAIGSAGNIYMREPSFALLEDGSFALLEDGSFEMLEG